MRKFLVITLMLGGCSSTPVDLSKFYLENDVSNSVVFEADESEGKPFGKGHEKIFLCNIEGEVINKTTLLEPVAVTPGAKKGTVCYLEGLNEAKATFNFSGAPGEIYKIKLGEHSWTEVNFWIENKKTGEVLIPLTTVPKNAGNIFEILPVY